jgi:outer membrane protein TolC
MSDRHQQGRGPKGGSSGALGSVVVTAFFIWVAGAGAPLAQSPRPGPLSGKTSTVQVADAQAGAVLPRPPAQPAPQVMSLDDVLALAGETSEQVTIAQAGVTRAEGQERRARSEWLPQLSASASYDRALASEFEGLFGSTGPTCTPFTLDSRAPLGDRVAEIERALRDCPPAGNIFGGSSGADDDGDLTLPFGRPNTYRVNLAFSQNVYTGGRLTAQRTQARLGRASAGLSLSTTRAQLMLDVAEAFFEATLSDRLVLIAEAALAQAEHTADQVAQQRQAGRLAEFDLLRAQVTRDSQRPEVIRRRNARDLAYLRVKQLLDLPLETPLQLVADLENAVLPPPAARLASALAMAESGSDSRERIALVQADNDVQQREAAVQVARAQRWPTVSLNSYYARVAYPSTVPAFRDFRANWTVGAVAQVPVLTGGRIKAEEMAARADLAETQARRQLARELATLDDASARLELANARSAWEATSGTVQQATRAYEIAELRYREGVSTQLELTDARLLLQQAHSNRAQAARDVQVARVRLALLPDLPLATPASAQQQQSPPPAQTAPQPVPLPGTIRGDITGAASTQNPGPAGGIR